jgi:hypothetical protein
MYYFPPLYNLPVYDYLLYTDQGKGHFERTRLSNSSINRTTSIGEFNAVSLYSCHPNYIVVVKFLNYYVETILMK